MDRKVVGDENIGLVLGFAKKTGATISRPVRMIYRKIVVRRIAEEKGAAYE